MQIVELLKQDIKPRDIMTEDAFMNALTVDMALGCSTNSMLHLPAIAHEFGIEIDADTFDRLHRGGPLPAEYPAGGTVAGTVLLLCRRCAADHGRDQRYAPSGCDDCDWKDAGRNLEDLKKNGFYEHCDEILRKKERGAGTYDPPSGYHT